MNFDPIDNALDIEVTPIEKDLVKKDPSNIIEKLKDTQSHVDKDYEYVRGNLYSLMEKGQEAFNGVLELAQESDSPRAYEVAGQLLKNASEIADKIMDLQQKMKDINKEERGSATTVTNNAVFVGSTSELQKFLKSSMNADTSK